MEEDEEDMAGIKSSVYVYHVRKEREIGVRREKDKLLYYCYITFCRKGIYLQYL